MDIAYKSRVVIYKLGYYRDSFMHYKDRGLLSATGPSSVYFNWRSLQFVAKQALSNRAPPIIPPTTPTHSTVVVGGTHE
jgi:hypothetical protein